jgi:hypothetical protein
VELGEFHRLTGEGVELGRLEVSITVAGEVAIAEVVGEEEDDIGAGGGRGGGCD